MTLDQFNALALTIFVLLLLIALALMARRLGWYRAARKPVSVILKRDVALFLSFAWVFGGVLFQRALGISLSREPLWVIPQGVFVLVAMAYWVWQEAHLDRPVN